MHMDGALICLEEIHHQRFWINIFFLKLGIGEIQRECMMKYIAR